MYLADNNRGSIDTIQQQRLVIDYQLELSKLRHELSAYQKHIHQLDI